MEPKIEIYDDYCVDMDSNDIQTILPWRMKSSSYGNLKKIC